MGERTAIEWTDSTWNPVSGCTKVSTGCKFCYAERVSKRMGKEFTKVTLHPDRLDQPLRWKKPRRIFVNSMSDLFHEEIPVAFLRRVLLIMREAEHHTFQVLTKRIDRGRDMLAKAKRITSYCWPLPNVWLGVSCENQEQADKRIALLLQTLAAVRFVSLEPLLGPIDLARWLPSKVCQDCGCNSGLDLQVRKDELKKGDDIVGSMQLPDADRLPSSADPVPIPPRLTAYGLSEPPHQGRARPVDRYLGAVRSEGVPSPLDVSLSVEDRREIADINKSPRKTDRAGQEYPPSLSSARNPTISDGPPHGRFADPEPRGNLDKGLARTIGRDDSRSCPCSCHSLHKLHCTIGWCIVGGESGGPPERALVERLSHPGYNRDVLEWAPKPEA